MTKSINRKYIFRLFFTIPTITIPHSTLKDANLPKVYPHSMEKYQSPGIGLGALVPQTAKSCDTGTRQQGKSVITTRKINGHREPELLFIEQEWNISQYLI